MTQEIKTRRFNKVINDPKDILTFIDPMNSTYTSTIN